MIFIFAIAINTMASDSIYTWSEMEAVDTTFQTGDWLWWRPAQWMIAEGFVFPTEITEAICTDKEIEDRNIEIAYAHADYCRKCDDPNDYIRTSTPGDGMRADSSISSRASSGTFDKLLVLRPTDKSRVSTMNDKCDNATGKYDWMGYYLYNYDTYIPTLKRPLKPNCLERKVARQIYELFPFLTIGVGHCHSASCVWATAGLKNPPDCHTFNMFKLLRGIRAGTNADFYIAGEYDIVNGSLIPIGE